MYQISSLIFYSYKGAQAKDLKPITRRRSGVYITGSSSTAV